MYIDIDRLDMESVIANSYKNFHTKGFDYICIGRTPALTEKLYFFNGDVSLLPDVVNPHDHRYHFWTTCLAGGVGNSVYEEVGNTSDPLDVFRSVAVDVFDYLTPLNGGDGFTHRGRTHLMEIGRWDYAPGERYSMMADEIHTIHINQPGTVLYLRQYQDVVPVGTPTRTYSPDASPTPTTADDGLYDKYTADEIVAQLRIYNDKVSGGMA
ncbi:hypothetical protein HOT75_gp102 [Gordonia phage Daredevil]|uniref:Uncharacterized protein n=1 Tax=Gordonia phage Daredevil TaxID=2283286 RepID=A0A345MIV8_9CAUD|nr:hypothetical protein HOT75_gp102 [Gordonia phage Daredevil]AXH70489.1 hypothetical protein SEA_DAREDEVIL_102 [Gordonia phage Daredevil]